jgi:hypothetical protein
VAQIRGLRQTMSQLAPEPAPDAGLESLLAYARKSAERFEEASEPAPKPSWFSRFFGTWALPAGLVTSALVVGLFGYTASMRGGLTAESLSGQDELRAQKSVQPFGASAPSANRAGAQNDAVAFAPPPPPPPPPSAAMPAPDQAKPSSVGALAMREKKAALPDESLHLDRARKRSAHPAKKMAAPEGYSAGLEGGAIGGVQGGVVGGVVGGKISAPAEPSKELAVRRKDAAPDRRSAPRQMEDVAPTREEAEVAEDTMGRPPEVASPAESKGSGAGSPFAGGLARADSAPSATMGRHSGSAGGTSAPPAQSAAPSQRSAPPAAPSQRSAPSSAPARTAAAPAASSRMSAPPTAQTRMPAPSAEPSRPSAQAAAAAEEEAAPVAAHPAAKSERLDSSEDAAGGAAGEATEEGSARELARLQNQLPDLVGSPRANALERISELALRLHRPGQAEAAVRELWKEFPGSGQAARASARFTAATGRKVP